MRAILTHDPARRPSDDYPVTAESIARAIAAADREIAEVEQLLTPNELDRARALGMIRPRRSRGAA